MSEDSKHFFSHAEARLQWANRHISKFERSVSRFVLSNDIVHTSQERAEWRDPYYVRVVTHRAKPKYLIPYHLCLLAGDAIHGLRATVDNLVWGLGQQCGCKTSLGLFFRDTKEQYEKYSKTVKYAKLPSRIKDWMESQQVYAAQDGNELFVHRLNSYWNRDKHRAPVLVTAARPAVVVGDEMEGHIDCLTIATEGDEVIAVAEGAGNLNPSYKLEVRFDGENENAIIRLQKISKYIQNVVFPLFQDALSETGS